MIAVALIAIALLCVPPNWHRISMPQRTRSGPVDQAVILDLAAAAIKAGVAIPAMLQAVHQALEDPAISLPHASSKERISQSRRRTRQRIFKRFSRSGGGAADSRGRTLREVANLLLLGATWEEAWEHVLPPYQRLAEVLAPAWNDGVAPVALLERAAQELRFSRVRKAKEAAARLGSMLVIPLAACYLPAFMLIGVLPVVVAAAQRLF